MNRQRFDALGQIGLNTDVEPSLLPPQAWNSLINVECRDGSLRSARGEQKLFDLTIQPLYHTTFMDRGTPLVIASDGLEVRAYKVDGTEQLISAATPWGGGPVTFANLNGILIVNSQTDGPFYWAGWGTPLDPLPGWDSDWRCRAMCAYRYYLVAVGMIETAASVTYDFIHKIRWSNSAAEGSIPTQWVPAVDNDAGDDLLGETPGALIGGVLLRDSLVLVKEDDLYSMNWIGGQYVMQIARLKGGVGTRSRNGFVEMRGAIATMSAADVLGFDGQQSSSLMRGRVREGYQRLVSTDQWERCVLFSHTPSTSLYVGIVPSGSLYIETVLRYDWAADTWSHFSVLDALGFDELQTRAQVSGSTDTWDSSPTTTWDAPDQPWDHGVYSPALTDVLVYESDAGTAAPGSEQYWVSVRALVETDSLDRPKYSKAERAGLPLEGVAGLAMVTRVWPEADGTIPFDLWVGGSMRLDETPRWTGPFRVTPRETASVPVRVTGRFVSFRVESQADGWWRLAALTVQHEPAGER